MVLVHGSMDRSGGLLKLSRRLDGDALAVRYDRRGYGRSVGVGGPYGCAQHVEDLAAVLADAIPDAIVTGRPVVLFGHSYGGNVALAYAARWPDRVDAVAVYETPLSWTDWWPNDTAGGAALGVDDPAEAAERFMRRLIGDDRWERLPASTRAARRDEGVAMVAELADLRARPPWQAGAIRCPVVAMAGERGREHHRRSVGHLATELDATTVTIAGASHPGPNTHPDAVAAVVLDLVRSVSGGG